MANEEKFRAPAYYDGIGPFPITQWDESGFLMEWSKYRAPHRRYQDAEALSIAPLVLTGEMAFINGVDGYENQWPQKFMQMRRRCQLPRNGYLRHQLYGEVYGHFSQFTPKYSTDVLNGCRVQYVFEQVLDPNGKQLDIVENNPLAGAKSAAAAVDQAVAALAAPAPNRFNPIQGAIANVFSQISQVENLLQTPVPPNPQIPQFPSRAIVNIAAKLPPFTELVASFEEFLQNEEATADDIKAEAERIKARFAEILDTPELQLAENSEVLQQVTGVQADVVRAGLEAQERSARLIEYSTDRDMTACEIAMILYEDPSRGDEIMRNNPYDGTQYPVGYTIRFLDL
jgi:hypothetical protein